MAPEWEKTFARYEIEGKPGDGDVALPPDVFARLATAIQDRMAQASGNGALPALVTTARRRRFLRAVAAARGVANPVLSYEEIGFDARPAILGQVAA
jgi:flagellar biosynthesis protein FlhA